MGGGKIHLSTMVGGGLVDGNHQQTTKNRRILGCATGCLMGIL